MLRALIVDDEIVVRIGLMSCIDWGKYGYEVVAACESGDEAAACLVQLKPDVVFTDIRMPGMDGLELTRYIREHSPLTKIIILSCLNEIDYVKRAIKLGAEDYVLKLSLTPQSLGELLERLRASIEEAKEKAPAEYPEGQVEFEREQAYRMLAAGEIFPGQRRQLLAQLGYDKARPGGYLILCCRVDDYENARQRGGLSDIYLMKYALVNVFREFLGKYPFADAVSVTDREYLLAIHMELGTDAASEIRAFHRSINEALSTHLNLTVSLGVSDVFEDPAALPDSYGRAREAAELCFFEGHGSIAFAGQLELTGTKAPDKSLPKLLQTAANGQNPEEALRLVKQWFDGVAANRRLLSPRAVRAAAVEAWVFVSGYSASGMEPKTEYPAEEDGTFPILWHAETLTGLRDALVGALLNLMEMLAQNQSCHPAILQFQRYLSEHIDENISLSQAAALCCLSRTYFCTLFKKETGENFVDYFNRLKMEKARQMLLTENIKVFEAGHAVGINDMSYFNKLFRKHFGLSPSQFKAQRRSELDTSK